MNEEKPKKKRIPKETISRERVRQIQSRALGKLRTLLYSRGITKMNDLL